MAEEPLIGRSMRNKTPQGSPRGKHKRECNHRRGTRYGCREKERELIHGIADRGAAARDPLVNLRRENILRNGERLTEEIDLVALGLQKFVRGILQKKVHLHETRADVIERVPAAIADVVLFNRSVDDPGKQMKDRSRAHVIPHGRVSVLQQLLRESHGTLPTMDSGKGVEVTQGKV